MIHCDVAVIGGGPAGMAAALEAREHGAERVVILERNVMLGGILNQCIHNGFGLHYFKEELTGPEYAARFVNLVEKSDIEVMLNTMVTNLTEDKVITAVGPEKGVTELCAKAVVLAMGCRERTAGAIAMAGTRPAGVYTAGMAQRLCNINGYMVGRSVVILGSGDIGLIMARRMTYEGAKVQAVLELMPYSSGLKRNIVQCLDDYGIPLHYSHTVTRTVGRTRLEGVYVAPVDGDLKPIMEKERYIPCDTLLLSVGLIPENDLINGLPIERDRVTTGAVVDETRQTSADGIFSCGNVLHVHDLVDNVSEEARIAGAGAAAYALGKKRSDKVYVVSASNGVRYALPQKITGGDGKVKIYWRVGNIYKNAVLKVTSGGETIFTRKYMILSPGEMESIQLDGTRINGDVALSLEV